MPGHTGGMIALVPADPDALAVDGGEAVDELHLTLAYLGDDVTGWPAARRDALIETMRVHAHRDPVTARVMAHAQFNPDGGPDGDRDPCAVYLVGDSDQLAPLRAAVLSEVGEDEDFPAQHEPFVAHVTAGYGLDPTALTFTGPVVFDRLRVALGGDVHDIPLGGEKEDDMPDEAIAAAVEAPVEVLDEDSGELRVRFPVVVIEGMSTSDGRRIEPGALRPRGLPLSLLAQTQSAHGGDEPGPAEVVGRIDRLDRVPGPEVLTRSGEPFPDGTFVWTGEGAIDSGSRVADLVRRGFLRGVSVDLVGMEFEVLGADEDGNGGELVTHAAELAAATLVPVPAFGDAYVELADGPTPDPDPAEIPEGLAASAVPAWRSAEVGDPVVLPDAVTAAGPSTAERRKAADAGAAMPDGSFPVRNAEDLDNAIQAVGRAKDVEAARRHIIRRAKALGLEGRIPDQWRADGTTEQAAADAVVVAAAGSRPAADWFADPGLDGPTPLYVGEDGRVYGHLAAWDVPHIGMPGRHVTAPRSQSGYAYFRVGAVLCDDGSEVPVGHITLDTGHAATSLGHHAAAAHYDDTGTVVADVAAGEDAHGIWVAGALRPGVDDATAARLRASAISGDWRRIGSGLELVAALAVNTPGFPIPRSRVASGTPLALVAAGAVPPETPRAAGAVVLDYDTLADAIADRLDARRATAELTGRTESALAALDDTADRAAEAYAALDDTAERAVEAWRHLADDPGEPEGLTASAVEERAAAALAALDDDASDEDLAALAALAADEGLSEEAFLSQMPPQLRESYLRGKVAARIRWGTPGDFTRCVAQAKVHGMGRKAEGACARLHRDAVGFWPGDRRNR
jgi:hypothetical protein